MGDVSPYSSGLFVVDKPSGITSYDVLRELKRGLKGVKIGYLGTLDPLATGVLPIMIGEGTKLAPFLESGDKVYEATLRLGITTDTYDSDGRILHDEDLGSYDLSAQRIEEVLQQLRGTIHQVPPMYSAVKQGGKPLYKLARMGRHVERRPRDVEIYELHVTGINLPSLSLHIECSKGTYVRALTHDIGEDLGCGAHLTALRRTQSGPFLLNDALSLEDVKELIRREGLGGWMIPLSHAVAFLPVVEIGEDRALRVHQGQAIPVAKVPPGCDEDGMLVRVLMQGEGGLVAVAKLTRGEDDILLKPLRVFHDVIFTKGHPCGRDTIENMDVVRRKTHGL